MKLQKKKLTQKNKEEMKLEFTRFRRSGIRTPWPNTCLVFIES